MPEGTRADTKQPSGGHGRSQSMEGGIWVGPGRVRVKVKGQNKGHRKARAKVESCACKA